MKSILKSVLIITIFILLPQTAIAQEIDKTVTLTVAGTGKTLEEAKTNALQSAIQQTFGVFISSKTEILNDNLIKDDIISVSNGNIQKFDIISESELPNIGYSCVLNAVVSISKLTSFIESKGGSTELKGSMLLYNLKIKNLAKESEFIAMKNISESLRKYLNSCFDYRISVLSEPLVISDDYVSIDLEMASKFNNNIELFKIKLLESLKGLSIDLNNVKEYQKLNIPTYNLFIGPIIIEKNKEKNKNKEVVGGDLIVLRNKKTYDELLDLCNFNQYASKFVIKNDSWNIDGKKMFELAITDSKTGNVRISKYNNSCGVLCSSVKIGVDDKMMDIYRAQGTIQKEWVRSVYANFFKTKFDLLINDRELNPKLINLEDIGVNNTSFRIEFKHLILKEQLSKITKYEILKRE
jgi:hypothetical protein